MPGDAGNSGRLGLVRKAPQDRRGLEPSWGSRWAGPRRAGLSFRRLGCEGQALRREEKEFGFRGAEGRLLLLQDCEVRVQVAEGSLVSGEAGLGGLLGLTP